jgi:hypothetical protein
MIIWTIAPLLTDPEQGVCRVSRLCLIARRCFPVFAAAIVGAMLCRPTAAQVDRGFSQVIEAYASGQERNRQTDFRVMEVQFKPMRMIWVDITDPKTGEKERKEVWYLVYRAMTRPTPGRPDETNLKPQNVVDPAPKRVTFMPEFILTTYDDPENPIPLEIHLDKVLPEAVKAIRVVEQRPANVFQTRKIESTLDVAQPFPDPIATDAPLEQQDWIYGVATWTGIDPETDYFTVTMRGFSNAFDMRPGPDGTLQPWRKVIVQDFSRRGDRFDPTLREFEFRGEPQWAYQPDETNWNEWTPPERVAEGAAPQPQG